MTPQKITVKIPRKQGELIPFDLEKWNTGKYEAAEKENGIARILCTDNGGNYPIVVGYGDSRLGSYTIDGRYTLTDTDTSLFLRKKSEGELPKDVYNNINAIGTGINNSSIEECENTKRYEQSERLAILHITYAWED